MSDVFSAMSSWMMNTLGLNVASYPPPQEGQQQPAAPNLQQQMALDAQKQQEERWNIQQAQQTKVFEVQQDITINKSQTEKKAFDKLDGYLRN